MLEAIRKNSRSTIIYVLFGVLIAVFVINFGPGSNGSGCGKALSTSFAARVSGSTISEQDYRMAYIALGGPQIPAAFARERHLKEFVMDKLIERELLAQEAEKQGFAVSDKEVEDLLAAGKMYILGIPRRADFVPAGGAFDYKLFQRFVELQLGTNVQRFIDVQRREMLADKLKQAMAGATKVTLAEARQEYLQKENQVNLEFVRLSARQFESKVEVAAAEAEAYVKAHEAELKKMYDERAFLYQKLERQARVRLVLAAVGREEADAAKVKAAEDKALRARARLGEKPAPAFAQVARELSDDAPSRARGGDLGWRKKGFTGLSKELDEQVFAAAPGALLGPVRTDRGFELVRVEKFREGDIPFEQVAAELAEDKVRGDKARALAVTAANEVVVRMVANRGKTLAEVYPKPAADESEADKRDPKPAAEETGMFARRGELVPQVGVSLEVVKNAFEVLKVGQTAGPFEVADSQVVVRLKEKREADMKYFDEHKDEQLRQLSRQKWADVLDDYAKQRCIEAREGKRLSWNDEVLSYDNAEGPAPTGESKYVPCGNRL